MSQSNLLHNVLTQVFDLQAWGRHSCLPKNTT